MLAYESVDKCKEDLLKYKLIIQSVPIVNPTDSASGSSSPSLSGRALATNSSNHKFNKTPNSTSTKTNQPKFEEVLDCKQSTLQGF